MFASERGKGSLPEISVTTVRVGHGLHPRAMVKRARQLVSEGPTPPGSEAKSRAAAGAKRRSRNAMTIIKSFVRSAIRAAGYDVHRLPELDDDPGRDPYFDMRRLVSSQRVVTIFDVGANVGQTIQRLRETFPQPTIHAF